MKAALVINALLPNLPLDALNGIGCFEEFAVIGITMYRNKTNIPNVDTSYLLCAKSPYCMEEYICELNRIYIEESIDCFVFCSDAFSCELAARLSARLCVPCVLGAKRIECEKDGLCVMRSVYMGEMQAQFSLKSTCCIGVSRDFPIVETHKKREAKVYKKDVDPVPLPWLQSYSSVIDEGAIDLCAAKRVFVAGGGIGSGKAYESIEKLANAFDAKTGATRPVVMSGWAPMSHQIGVSGSAISPDVCVVLAASGAEAFACAIEKSKLIVAVNTDECAPIFKHASLGIVEDYKSIVECLHALVLAPK